MNTDTDAIRIIKILDPETAVVNAGENAGLRENEPCSVYSAVEDLLEDPQTGNKHGKMQLRKGNAVITQLGEKYAVIKAIQRQTRSIDKILALLGDVPAFGHFDNEISVGDVIRRE